MLVWISGGEFLMGGTDASEDERPQHTVRVAGFWLGRYEVTHQQYGRFLEASGRQAPSYWDEENYNKPDLPIVAVTWLDAQAYCEWAGLRLPTEAEWEYVASGAKQFEYPTATGQISHEVANYHGVEGRDRWEGPSPVGSFPPGPYGMYDLAGNAWEWTSTLYQSYPYSASDGREENTENRGLRVLRGGSWHFSDRYCRTRHRRRFASHLRYDYAGLRVALTSVEPESSSDPPNERSDQPPSGDSAGSAAVLDLVREVATGPP